MSKIEYPVACPLLEGRPISIGECFDIHMVVSGEAPKWTAPKEIFDTPDYAGVCNRCKYHRYD